MIRSRLDTTATRELTLNAHLDVSNSSVLRSVVWSLASCKLASELGGESCDSNHMDRLNVTTQTAPWRDSYRSMPLVLSPAMSVQRQPENRRHTVPLSLRAAVLRPGREYIFRLEAQYNDANAMGFAEVLVTTNVPPQSRWKCPGCCKWIAIVRLLGRLSVCAKAQVRAEHKQDFVVDVFETSPQLPLQFRFGFVQNASSLVQARQMVRLFRFASGGGIDSQEVVLSGY